MSVPPALGDGAGDDMTGMLRDVEAWMTAYTSTLRSLSEQRLTGSAAEGRVSATVSGAGRLLRVDIDPKAMRDLDHLQLAAAIQEAVTAARAVMGERLDEAMSELNGPRPRLDAIRDPLAPHIDALLKE